MAVPNAPFEEAISLGKRYRRFNDAGNAEAFDKTYSEFLELKDQFSDFNDKVTIARAFLSAYNGKIFAASRCNCTRCKSKKGM